MRKMKFSKKVALNNEKIRLLQKGKKLCLQSKIILIKELKNIRGRLNKTF